MEPPRSKALASLVIVVGFPIAMLRLAVDAFRRSDPARQAVGLGATLSALLIAAAFLVNRNIFNSDNYRYLIFLLAPWTLGFGLLMQDLTRRGLRGRVAAISSAGLLAAAMTAMTFYWYRDTRHYLDDDAAFPAGSGPPRGRRCPCGSSEAGSS